MADWTAIEFDGEELILVYAETRGSEVSIRRAVTLAVPEHATDAASRSAWFTHEMRGLDWPKTPCSILFPRDEAILRKLEVPAVSDDELAPLVRFQAAAKFSGGIETLALDYLPLKGGVEAEPGASGKGEAGQGRSVLAVTVPQAVVAESEALCKMAQLDPKSATVVPVALAELVAMVGGKAEGDGGKGQRLLISEHGGRIEISLYDGGSLVYSHWAKPGDVAAAQIPQILAGEVARTLVAARQVVPELSVGQVWLLLEQVDATGLQGLLSSRLNCPVDVLSLPASVRWSLSQKAGEPVPSLARYAGPLAAIIGSVSPVAPVVNFLSPRKLIEKKDPRRRQWAMAGGGVAAAVLTWVGMTVWEFQDLDRRLGIERSERDKTKVVLEKGDEKLKSMQAVQGWLGAQPVWLDEWKHLLGTLPATDRMYVKSIRFEPAARAGNKTEAGPVGRVAIEGFARERADVLSLTERLVASSGRYEVTPPSAKSTDDDNFYPWKVDLSMQIRPETKAARKAEAVPQPAVTKPAVTQPAVTKPAAAAK